MALHANRAALFHFGSSPLSGALFRALTSSVPFWHSFCLIPSEHNVCAVLFVGAQRNSQQFCFQE
ncbi:hypothetical protein K7R23_18810 [Citrobacter rodentium NBRC 105723 = DSM 16636]|uniref:hypothetical protein n=1 Tax=Citrobacter rodentium TaxID=67825 RepID=UPI000A61AAD2|nr:hypothetical protein [Citrobacter rodentium]UHO30030.1 hypothetical protein K7R23_18810 [Citrobacter rodentium NBRC 105723 = DSM 16636]